MQSRAGLIDHTPMIQRAPQLLGNRTGSYQPGGMPETMRQELCFTCERVVIPRFEGGGKVADTAELATQNLARYQFLNLSIRVNRGFEHSPTRYTSMAFGRRCREAGVRPSMGSVGDCFDNAMCESFFATLECELLDRRQVPWSE